MDVFWGKVELFGTLISMNRSSLPARSSSEDSLVFLAAFGTLIMSESGGEDGEGAALKQRQPRLRPRAIVAVASLP